MFVLELKWVGSKPPEIFYFYSHSETLLDQMSLKIEKISEPLLLGEGPHWDSDQKVLYFVSILEHTIHRYDPATGEHAKTKLDGRVGFIVPVDGTTDQFVVGVERKFLVIQWDGTDGAPAKTLKVLGEVDKDVPTTRINDGKADPKGRLFGGTMGNEDPPGNFERAKGSLYRIVGPGAPEKLCDKIDISNGLAWDLEEKAFYYIDSLERAIRRYDYDAATGDISNMKLIFDFDKNDLEGVPDGMTIDTDGNLWVAVFDGSSLLKVDPRTEKLLQKIPIPALQVTSATFGGPNLDILFVTTASINIKGVQEPPCGATFMITGLGVKGHPNANFKLY
ncbi:Regucalcin [Eumeta japonica]|uniref:Regucalcin n=1 Tax=Eumeta variegata TaxID=151549 RepID=A0A4C1WVM0_EUMVA|nr:Regucalcin [Eumeta japonica]